MSHSNRYPIEQVFGQMMGVITMASHAAKPDYELLRGGSDLLEVALLAARGSAAARRLAEGESIDADDEQSLSAIAQLLEASAEAVKSFGPAQPGEAPPSGALAARVDVAIEAVLHDADQSLDVESLSRIFESLAAQVRQLVAQRTPELAEPLVGILERLASSVLRETGHVGETTSTL